MTLIIKNLLFTVVVPGTVAVCVPLLIAEGQSPTSLWNVALALLAFVVGVTVYAWCVWDFAAFGRGTPAPIDAPKKLVVRGLYRYSRNPMYLGVLLVVVGWALLFRSRALVLYAALVAIVFHLVVVLYEERHLHRVFGDEYDSYRAQVGRWLPRWSRRYPPS
jgi:protein-S-isoprenylcysteine O-methyltransferase Ste14